MNLFAKKSVADVIAHSDAGDHKLNRALGPYSLVSLGIGAIIGAGLFSLTGLAAAQNAGPAVALSMIIAGIGCAFAGLCYSEFACLAPVAGSAYTFAYASLGEWMAWIIGWDLVLEYAVASSAVSISWSGYVASFVQDMFGFELPAQLIHGPWDVDAAGQSLGGFINLPAVLIIIVISLLLMVGIRQSAALNNVIVVVKLLVVFTFIGIGWMYIHRENYTPFIPENTGKFGEFGFSGVMKGAGTIFFAYIGFDAVSTAAQEARNPQRDMPIGILGSLAICTVLYVVFSFVLTGMVNYKELGVPAPVAVAIDQTPYEWLRGLIKFGIIAGFTSVILVLLLGQSRVFFSMSRDGLVPAAFSEIHPRFRTPWKSNLLFMLFIIPFSAFLPIRVVGEMTSIGTLFAFVIVCGAVLVLRRTEPGLTRPFKTPWIPVVPILGIVFNFAMMYSLGWENWLRLLIWFVAGQVIYFGYSRHRSRLQGRLAVRG